MEHIAFRNLEEGEFFIDPNEEVPCLRSKISSSLSWAYKRAPSHGQEVLLEEDPKHARRLNFSDEVIRIAV